MRKFIGIREENLGEIWEQHCDGNYYEKFSDSKTTQALINSYVDAGFMVEVKKCELPPLPHSDIPKIDTLLQMQMQIDNLAKMERLHHDAITRHEKEIKDNYNNFRNARAIDDVFYHKLRDDVDNLQNTNKVFYSRITELTCRNVEDHNLIIDLEQKFIKLEKIVNKLDFLFLGNEIPKDSDQ